MMIRKPVVAGQFYPASASQLKAMIEGHTNRDVSIPVPTLEELEELKPIAKAISDRFHSSVCATMTVVKAGDMPLYWALATV